MITKRNICLYSPANLKCDFGKYYFTKHIYKSLCKYFFKKYVQSFNWSELYDHYVFYVKVERYRIYLDNKKYNG